MRRFLAIAALIVLGARAFAAVEIELRSPLTTLVKMSAHSTSSEKTVSATITVPADAPSDLGVGVFLRDQHGRWYQRCSPSRLTAGTNRVQIHIGSGDAPIGENHKADWNGHGPTCAQLGLFFWSTHGGATKLTCSDFAVTDAASASRAKPALLDLEVGGLGADGFAHGKTGERWSLSVRPQPFPDNPYDSEAFQLEALITGPDKSKRMVPAFYLQPMSASDRGDREEVVPSGSGRFEVRYRPSLPGRYTVELRASWKGAEKTRELTSAVATLNVTGEPWDDYVRIDAKDPRFFQANGTFFWPIGLNIRSVTDIRATERLGTKVTPMRGTLAYDDYLRRFAAHGGNAVEIWMSSWNLALEWRGDWPTYYGAGRYNEENAWRLDRVLDLADQLGIRVNLVINNHGQASTKTDQEWNNSPLNKANGGKLSDAEKVFTDPWALASQDKIRRYIVARYADHPSVLGWKLWSEINLTAGERTAVIDWHAKATQRWHDLDIYQHGCTTHWSGSWRTADPSLGSVAGLNYLCIDAYHQPVSEGGELIAQILFEGTTGKLGKLRKPILVTEFGGDWKACPQPQLIAEHAIGPWAALVSGNGGAPMLWWFEWVDQRDEWKPYDAISTFVKGEDLRSADANPVTLTPILPDASTRNAWWIRAWSRPGRMLGYVLDSGWGANGIDIKSSEDLRIEVGTQISPGEITLEWWNADTGAIVKTDKVSHPGGRLVVPVPQFQRHIAFKLYR